MLDKIEIFFIDYEYDRTRKVVYAPLHGYLDLIEKDHLDQILKNSESPKRKSLLAAIKDKPLINIKNVAADFSRQVPALDLALTEKCSLRCPYCHASAGEGQKKSSMSKKMIAAVLEAYFAHLKPGKPPQVQIGFSGGGEPAYNPALLKHAVSKAVEVAAEHGAECQFSMATNGYYGEEVRGFIINNFREISLSLDGPEAIQNLHRPALDGRGSFNLVYETARYFQEQNYTFAFRATVSEYSLHYLDLIVDFFADNFPGRSLKLEPLNPVGRAKENYPGQLKAPDKAAFSERLIQILDYARDKPLKILNSASTEFDKIRVAFCSNVAIPNWIVDSRGNIRACPRSANDDFLFGRFDRSQGEAVIFDEKISRLRKMSAIYDDQCKDCFCKYHCAGDCAERRISDRSDCNSIRNVGAHLLSQKIHDRIN